MGKGIVAWVALAVLVITGEAAFAGPPADAQQARGEQTYSEFCSACHGRYGRGDGPLTKNLKRMPPDFTDPTWIAGRADSQIAHSLVGASHGPMAMAGVLKSDALLDSIVYIRTLSVPGKHVSVAAGRDVYNSTCWPCHGTKGDGNGPVAKFLEGTKPRDFTAATFVIDGREDEIVQFITVGAVKAAHGSHYMPEWASRLSPQQIRDTVEYLKTFKTPPH
ncbi:MAG TPA: c-type cytochrome [Candidatus Dormibacteraeota bacterium]|nr:c-type cytochrome [Candidatus Dormibacteraeota bacterium]